jgi:hypothetical protein
MTCIFAEIIVIGIIWSIAFMFSIFTFTCMLGI